ncbi:tetratricopeptide repeat protein [Ruegeria sp. ANG10]|uniref:tetratricopeptide repeat protein n=1 Tax=Ruegeria sp. ANG10 TaxID=3042467 RepID=UPI0034569296
MASDIRNTEKTNAMQAVCDSELFTHLDRLCAFLKYIVTEELEGRGALIMGKTIAQDVYDRDPAEEGDINNVVRVDARRLRQNLEHYYDTAGCTDPVRIFVDTGGYRPRFERVAIASSDMGENPRRTFGWAALSFVVGTGIGIGIALIGLGEISEPQVQQSTQIPTKDSLRRQAVIEQSASSLQAMNLADQARSMMFPIFDRPRQQLVTEVFRRVIELGPDYFGGYAGAAQALATLAIMTPPGPEKSALTSEALAMADNALRLAPADPWAQSAQAWAKFANREYDEAMRISKRAVALAPNDEHVLDIHGSIALFSGHFAEAARHAEKAMNGGRSNQRFANRNIFGAANFHLENYQTSLDAFSAAASYGDPISAPSFAYQTAALYELGKTKEAARKYAELKNSWPDADVEKMLTGIFKDPSHAEKVIKSMKALESNPN